MQKRNAIFISQLTEGVIFKIHSYVLNAAYDGINFCFCFMLLLI